MEQVFLAVIPCRGLVSVRPFGHADLMTTARTYTHVLADEQELDYLTLIAR